VKLAPETMPVTLYNFTATLQNAGVRLQWTTTQEVNAGYYEVERSADGVHFTLLGSVTAAHNSSTIKNYRFTDNKILQGENFYRLKQIDEDGNFTYSVIRKINYANGNTNTIIISPNPFSNSTTISFTLPQTQKASVIIYDMAGRVRKTLANTQLQQGTHQLIWNAKDEKGNAVVAGIYVLRMQAGNYAETKKLIVVK
jgi:hypothetical protein